MIALADNIFYSAMEDHLTRGREIMRLEKPRIQPLTLENCNEDQAKMLKQQQIRGKPANIFLTMANHRHRNVLKYFSDNFYFFLSH